VVARDRVFKLGCIDMAACSCDIARNFTRTKCCLFAVQFSTGKVWHLDIRIVFSPVDSSHVCRPLGHILAPP
jgi:hypothetical protein